MKRILGIIALFISFCASAQDDKVIPNRPSPPKLVNDFTGTPLTTGAKACAGAEN